MYHNINKKKKQKKRRKTANKNKKKNSWGQNYNSHFADEEAEAQNIDLAKVVQQLNHSQDWNLGLLLYFFTVKKKAVYINSLMNC